MPWSWHGAYNDKNYTLQNELWEAINIDSGIVALSDSYVASKQLPVAQRFPWDKEKGLYLLNGHHNLHCLVRIAILGYMSFQLKFSATEENPQIRHAVCPGARAD